MSNKHQATLDFVKATKGSYVYANALFPGVYIPKTIIAEISHDGGIPEHITMTLTVKEEN